MAAAQQHISSSTPMGANLVNGGATFRVWAPRAKEVYACGDFNGWTRDPASLLVKHGDNRWTGFMPGAQDGQSYKFYVVGEGILPIRTVSRWGIEPVSRRCSTKRITSSVSTTVGLCVHFGCL
jgi:1,4-alpha-glucan branching enzyme